METNLSKRGRVDYALDIQNVRNTLARCMLGDNRQSLALLTNQVVL